MRHLWISILLAAALAVPVRAESAGVMTEPEAAAQLTDAGFSMQITDTADAGSSMCITDTADAGSSMRITDTADAETAAQTEDDILKITDDTSQTPAALRDFLKKHHPAPFTKMTEEEFDAQISELTQNWNVMEEAERYYDLRRLVAALGDEHTSLLPPEDIVQPELPFFVMIYDGHWMIVQAQKEYGTLVGKELTAINDIEISRIREMLLPLISCETQQWADVQCSLEVRYLQNLNAVGAADDLVSVDITAKDVVSGEEITVEAEALNEGYDYQNTAFYPMAQTLAQSGYYYANLLEDGSVFIQYNVCAENPQMPMKEFAQELERQLLADAPEKVIVDLRHNSGGDSEVIRPLLETLQKFQEKGSTLYCLIGAQTFSSGVMNAIDMQQIGAQLVGEPTGGVLHFGELTQEILPDGSIFVCSTKDFSSAYALSGQLQPETEVVQTAEDFLAGKDTVIAYIQEQ